MMMSEGQMVEEERNKWSSLSSLVFQPAAFSPVTNTSDILNNNHGYWPPFCLNCKFTKSKPGWLAIKPPKISPENQPHFWGYTLYIIESVEGNRKISFLGGDICCWFWGTFLSIAISRCPTFFPAAWCKIVNINFVIRELTELYLTSSRDLASDKHPRPQWAAAKHNKAN